MMGSALKASSANPVRNLMARASRWTVVRFQIAEIKFVHSNENETVAGLVADFAATCEPVEKTILVMSDLRTGARFVECHVRASKLIELATVDVPIDPDEQPEYRANRDVVEDHVAFEKMREDAKARRTFSNIVSEYSVAYDAAHPIKIIGGQRRYIAIKEALESQVDEYHGLKVYFSLDSEQRLDVQLISNTNIAVSTDLFDRMQETLAGPELREWCQKVGLLQQNVDFADRRQRTNPITVRDARTFILNYFLGLSYANKEFALSDTTPKIARSGDVDSEWDALRSRTPPIWEDLGLTIAGNEFARLIAAQRAAFAKPSVGQSKTKSTQADFANKALNFAVLSAWAFVAGLLSNNPVRLKRHYALAATTGKDPLAAALLAKGKHKSDPENYRGLGYRTDAKERGRLVELFYLQAEDGNGINAKNIEIAIKKYHAKEAQLDVTKAQESR